MWVNSSIQIKVSLSNKYFPGKQDLQLACPISQPQKSPSEPRETFEDALKREIKEELKISISIKSKIIEVPYRDERLNILLHYYLCEKMGDIRLIEHENGVWVSKSDLYRFKFAPGDHLILKHL